MQSHGFNLLRHFGDKRWNLPFKLVIEVERELLVRDNMEGMDRLEKEFSDNCRTVRKLDVSRRVFSPYPFNMSILLKFLRRMPSLQMLCLREVVIDGVERINDDVSVMCEYLHLEGLSFDRVDELSPPRLNLMSLLSLLHHFPALENLSLRYGEITSNIEREWNEESSSRICPKLKDFSISLDILPCWRGKSQSSKCRDVSDIGPLISYMPSIEKCMLSIDCHRPTDGMILLDKLNLTLNVTRTYKSMKVLIVSSLIRDILEVSANILANITKRMPMLEILTVANITVVGDVESSMGQLENLKEFKWTDSSIVENNLIMI